MKMKGAKPRIAVVGQGYVGGSYADLLEKRGHEVVRYSLEPAYRKNKDRVRVCDVVFICTPTPTTPKGFDASAVESGIALARSGAAVIIKSTVLPGTTKRLQRKFADKVVLFSPEFLSAATAAYDARHPFSAIVGCPVRDRAHKIAAERIIGLLPRAPRSLICDSTEAEIIKYAHNVNGYMQVVFANLLYDLARIEGVDWKPIEKAIEADPFMSGRYYHPIHKTGRGAGGGCFVKDFAAFRQFYAKRAPNDGNAKALLAAIERKNIQLLTDSGKDLTLIEAVYGSRKRRKSLSK